MGTRVSSEQLALRYDVSVETIKRDFNKLQKLKIIERIGSRKTGFWKLVNHK